MNSVVAEIAKPSYILNIFLHPIKNPCKIRKTLAQIQKIMKFQDGLTAALIGVSIAIVQSQIANALSSGEVARIAKAVTVLIKSSDSGSGVIVKRQGKTYTVLTAGHVVSTQDEYKIITPDGKEYFLDYSKVKKLAGVDLALAEFNSDQTYSVAVIGDSTRALEGTSCYVAGFPGKSKAITESIYSFTEGKITANANRPLADGYALVYSNQTFPGMSGGSVLNEKGELIGIHGRADTVDHPQNDRINPDIYIKSGMNLAIPINTFLRLAPQVGKNLSLRAPAPTSKQLSADDFYLQGTKKFENHDYQGAINDYSQAIILKSQYAYAYFGRATAFHRLGKYDMAIADYERSIRFKPDFASPYLNRGIVYIQRKQSIDGEKLALNDFNRAVELNSKDALAYSLRGYLRIKLGDKKGGLEDLDQALRLNPKDYRIYGNRGTARSRLGDKQGAIADYNQVIALHPKDELAYYGRGKIRSELGDKKGAISDYDQAIRINPNDIDSYYARGLVRSELGDKKGAISDYGQAIRINPNDANTYYARGLVRNSLGDKEGAIQDLTQAATLAQQQNDQTFYGQIQSAIQKMKP
jgi:tetratricopeptide (TPR) repeat protein